MRQGLAVEILSGDRAAVVEGLASKLGIHDFSAGLLPGGEGGPGRGARQAQAGRS